MKISGLRPLLLALALTSPFWGLGHPLWEVDDARYAEIPREMSASGDWVTPRLNYLDYVEKPPLIYWLAAASYRLFGVNEAAARLPLALLALLGLLGTWWLGSWLFSSSVGFHALLILATSLQFFGLGHLITPDMAVSSALLWATGMILRGLRKPADARWAGPCAWTAMALAVLAKGLIGLLLPGLWTAGLLLLFPALRKGLKPFLLGWGPLLFLLITAPWFIAMERRHPGFFHFFFVEQHFLRYLTPQYNRPGPWYYFFLVELGGTMPWTPLALTALLCSLASGRRADDRSRQLGLWALLVFGFFSASSSKLITYILPLFAHQSILAGELLGRLQKERALAKGIRMTAGTLACLLAAAACLLPLWTDFPLSVRWTASAALLAFAGALAAIERFPERTAGLALAANALLLFGAGRMTDRLSVKPLGLEIDSRIRELQTGKGRALRPLIMTYDGYFHGLPFYTGRPVDVVVNWVGELHYAKRDVRFERRFGDDDTVRALQAPGSRVYLALKTKSLPHLLSLKSPGTFQRIQIFGAWTLAEL